MSYNIDTWKTKELVDLMIPVASFYKHERSDWHPERVNHDDGTVSFRFMESYVRGTLDAESLAVTEIEFSGEGSGTGMHWILEPALKDSTGKLVAACVWEGGDSIQRLTVQDGVVKWEDVEL